MQISEMPSVDMKQTRLGHGLEQASHLQRALYVHRAYAYMYK